jgi:hypothetical protein
LRRPVGALAAATLCASAFATATASAAVVTVGPPLSLPSTGHVISFGNPVLTVEDGSGSDYSVPFDGTVTAWRASFDCSIGCGSGLARASVLRPVGDGKARVVAVSAAAPISADVEASTSLPVLAGDRIALVFNGYPLHLADGPGALGGTHGCSRRARHSRS